MSIFDDIEKEQTSQQSAAPVPAPQSGNEINIFDEIEKEQGATPASAPPSYNSKPNQPSALDRRWKTISSELTEEWSHNSPLGYVTAPVESALTIGAGIVNGAFDVVSDVFKFGYDKLIPENTKQEINYFASTNPALRLMTDALAAGDKYFYEKAKLAHPRDAAALENMLSLLMAKPFLDSGVNLMKKGAGKWAEAAHPPPEPAQALRQVAKPTGKTPGAVAQDLGHTVQTLADLDTTNINTYDDLYKAIDQKKPELMKQVDEALSADPTPYKMEELATVEKSAGGKEVSTNYVQEAIKNLREMYGKVGNKVEAQNMAELEFKARKQGLTKKEVNDLARKYGMEFSAFHPTSGNPLTSVSAERYEQTRKGLKGVAQKGMPDDIKQMDQTYHSYANTQRLLNATMQRLETLKATTDPRGWFAKKAGKVFDFIDTMSMGTVRGFLNRANPRGVGKKLFNANDLEEKLSRNLKIIDNAIKAKSPQELDRIMKGAIDKLAVDPDYEKGLKISEKFSTAPPPSIEKFNKSDKISPMSSEKGTANIPAKENPMAEAGYKGQHRPVTIEGGAARLDNLAPAFGEDIYGKDAIQYFGTGDDALDRQTLNILKSLKGQP